MASEKNLNAVFTDIANAIREKKGTTDQIKPINMADEIVNLPSGGGTEDSLKAFIAERGAVYLFYQYQGTEITSLRFEDTSGLDNTGYMFASCSSLTSVPLLDTSSVTRGEYMFNSCSSLTTIPQFDMSNLVHMQSMFSYCYKLSSIPNINTKKVENMYQTFYKCSSLKTIPQLDTSSLTYLYETFSGCSSLETIPSIDVSKVTSFVNTFYECSKLKSILMYGMKASFNISASTQFEESDLVTILNNLATVTSTKTLTMGSTNLAKLTDEEKAIATNKGWTLK